MLNLISMAVVGLVVFSIWLYGVRVWHEDFEFGDDFVAIFLAHAFFIGFPFCFFIGLYHTSLFAKKFVTRSFRRSEIDVNHFLETIGKDSVRIEDDKIIFGEMAAVDTKSLVMIIRQKSGETKTFNISKSDLKKILPVANNGVKMNFYDAIASSLEIENK